MRNGLARCCAAVRICHQTPPIIRDSVTENAATNYASEFHKRLVSWINDFDAPLDGNLIVSTRNQDWLYKVDYNNGTGTGNVLWLMGLGGAFAFNNIYADPYPWFSHQHDAEIYNTATGEFTVFDNGTTRVAPPPIGLGSGNSRGMVY